MMLQTIRKDGTIVNYTDLGRSLNRFCSDNLGFMLKSIGAGFLDGGCLPLALALKSLYATLEPHLETKIVSIGMSDADHAVLEVSHPSLGRIYLDGDGAATLDEICKKMLKVEMLEQAEIYAFNFDQDEVLSYEEIGLPAQLLKKLGDSRMGYEIFISRSPEQEVSIFEPHDNGKEAIDIHNTNTARI